MPKASDSFCTQRNELNRSGNHLKLFQQDVARKFRISCHAKLAKRKHKRSGQIVMIEKIRSAHRFGN
jgi:hypothetical protein